uniref:Uncharacterized protein n=1 Tax=Lepeophtheirus salmonis TaxID=72036 RepID=A0A0K2TRF0_LEPSM
MMAYLQIFFVVVGTLILSTNAQFPGNGFGFNEIIDNSFKPTTTPVPILNFLDRQNPDGSYTYGYENGDGTYKVETRHPTGEVEGKYGYIDSNGELREVEYGASPDRGFQPRINGVNVAPPAPAPAPGPPKQKESFIPNLRQNVAKKPSGRRVGVVKRRRPNVSPSSAFIAPVFSPVARPFPSPPSPPTTRSQRPGFPVEESRSSASFVPFNSKQLLALNPILRLHPAQNINLNDGSYTLEYSGK